MHPSCATGGILVSEGCPAYWGLDELFGARESYVEFTPDLLDDLELNVLGAFTRGGSPRFATRTARAERVRLPRLLAM